MASNRSITCLKDNHTPFTGQHLLGTLCMKYFTKYMNWKILWPHLCPVTCKISMTSYKKKKTYIIVNMDYICFFKKGPTSILIINIYTNKYWDIRSDHMDPLSKYVHVHLKHYRQICIIYCIQFFLNVCESPYPYCTFRTACIECIRYSFTHFIQLMKTNL